MGGECVQVCDADIYGAAQQRSSLHGPLYDGVKISGRFAQLVHLRHTTREVLKAFWRTAAWQGLIAAVQPDIHTHHIDHLITISATDKI